MTISILVVDDEAFVAENLRLKLKRLGHRNADYRVDGCENGNRALEYVARRQYDIIFVDIRMPFVSGLSVIRELRERGYGGKLWVLSGYDDFNTVRQAFLNGADDYLLKPIEIDQLNQKLTSYLAQRESTKPEDAGQELREEASKDVMDYAQEYILDHYSDSNLSMDEVATSVSLSYSHFSNLFRRRMNMTFPAYLLRLRVSRAMNLLQDPDLNITSICYKCGFKYPQQFSRDFKKITGVYPTQYRKSLQKKEGSEGL